MASSIATLACLLATTASAQNVRFWLSYQDFTSATLNAKAIGDEIKSNDWWGGLASLTIGLMATGLESDKYSSGAIMFAYDAASVAPGTVFANKAAFDAVTLNKVLNIAGLSGTSLVSATGLPGEDSNGNPILVNLTPSAASKYASVATSYGPISFVGYKSTFNFGGSGKKLVLAKGQSVMLQKIVVGIDQDRLGTFAHDYFGDGLNEPGRMIFGMPGIHGHTTYLLGDKGYAETYPVKYGGGYMAGTPIAVPDSYNVIENGTLSVPAPGVTANDIDQFENLAYVKLTRAPIHASYFVLHDDGSFVYVPKGNFVGVDSFDYSPHTGAGGDDGTLPTTATITVVEAGTHSKVRGHVNLQDFAANPIGETVTFEVRNAQGQTVETIRDIELHSFGSFSFESTLAGNYTIAVKGKTWLTDAISNITLGPSQVNADFSLINGDVNGDNYIGTDDYLRLSAAFDTSMADPAFDDNADLNGDGYVGTDDYLILNKNFDQQGL